MTCRSVNNRITTTAVKNRSRCRLKINLCREGAKEEPGELP